MRTSASTPPCAVRVVQLQDVATKAALFAMPAAGVAPRAVHRVEDAALDGFQPISTSGAPADDDRHPYSMYEVCISLLELRPTTVPIVFSSVKPDHSRTS